MAARTGNPVVRECPRAAALSCAAPRYTNKATKTSRKFEESSPNNPIATPEEPAHPGGNLRGFVGRFPQR
jgi:hypothetical protein